MTLVLIRVALAAAMLWAFLLIRGERLAMPPGAASAFLVLALTSRSAYAAGCCVCNDCAAGLEGSVVVEHNGTALLRSEVLAAGLRDGDRLELVRAVAGG